MGSGTSRAVKISIEETEPERAQDLFENLGKQRVNVDVFEIGESHILFTTKEGMAKEAEGVCKKFARRHGGNVEKQKIAIVRIVGEGLREASGVVGKVLSALQEVGEMTPLIQTSEITISVVVPEEKEEGTVRLLHKRLIEDEETEAPPASE